VSDLPILTGLREIAAAYDALICDVWGVVHDGAHARAAACDALKEFRGRQGRVVLLSNAPRPVSDLELQFARLGVPEDCYDAIVTSGAAARAALARRTASGRLKILHLGPDRDRGVFDGLPLDTVPLDSAEIVLCTGLFDDDNETPADYRELFETMRSRGLVMLCANPDRVVQRGGRLVYCAGALAEEYERSGGQVIYYGKPHLPIYELVVGATRGAKWPLAIGDGLSTDIRGANEAGLDALFIADGVHGEDIEPFTPEHLGELLNRHRVHARAAMRTLVW
jgi:HAD superfamily hydrolase (TIGR01459 family)